MVVFAAKAILLTQQKGVRAMEFGTVLRKMRKNADMSQEDIAHELHMSISNVSRLETNKYELKAVDLVNWANVTGTQDLLIATILSVDVSVVQQILDSSVMVLSIILGGLI